MRFLTDIVVTYSLDRCIADKNIFMREVAMTYTNITVMFFNMNMKYE